ncbi:MAG: beta galactosidase jelly roll domain-containing protein, partial [Clostridia bacterium]|nr:beta galactosidase jelly roll domain-containing protein [Clostridia bacterium]
MNLNGKWNLYYYPAYEQSIKTVEQLKNANLPMVEATVPGNVELDLSAAGVLPKDLYMGENIREAEKFETYDWWYETEFDAPAEPKTDEKVILHFGAVDCVAEYFLNGEKIGESDNMFIAHDFDVADKIKYNQKNTLHVHISSATIESASYSYEPNMAEHSWSLNTMGLNVRKAPHCFGWDIMPRAVSAGIWRDVELQYKKKYDFRYLYFKLQHMEGKDGYIAMLYDSDLPPKYVFDDITFKLKGVCKEHTFEGEIVRKSGAGKFEIRVPDIKLWWPKHYGEPNLYTITVEAYGSDGKLLLSRTVRRGFRWINLDRSEMVEPGGRFNFIVNNQKIMVVGTNWVPMDAYHSRDKARYKAALEMANDLECNIIRCWGGNVYEDHEFFDFCDEHGIMVWQDFAMACHVYCQDEWFKEKIKKEAEWVVKELRDHPSLVLWAGDNEIDYMYALENWDPNVNHLTREVLPRVVERLDPARPYIPSSPYISPEAFQKGGNHEAADVFPEDHLWGSRDYFKSRFYTESKAYFVSEMGYHGCPAKESIEKFITPKYVWPYFENPEWTIHSSDQDGNDKRVILMHNQVIQLFGEVPDNIDDFVLASQISQAEAKKFFIERVRLKMERMGGIIWWNLVDGWPQMSDAVVDYYYNKKLAYDFIKRSSRPFIIALDETDRWGNDLICCNSTLSEISGKCKVYDIDSGEILFEDDFIASPNSNTIL